MRKLALIVSMGVCAAVAAFMGYQLITHKNGSSASIARDAEPSEAVISESGDIAVGISAPALSPSSGEARQASLFSHLPTSRKGMPLVDDPFVAESFEEQMWLDRNGYPNAEQMLAYTNASDGQLERAAADGDKLAKVTLESRRLQQGDQSAVGRLIKDGMDGSMYAISRLAAYEAGAPAGNRQLAYTLSRVQEMAGDTRVAGSRPVMFGTPLSAEAQMTAERDALDLFKKMQSVDGKPLEDVRPYP